MNAVTAQPLRVLVVATHEPWPLNHGGRLHLYHVLRELAPAASITLALTTPPAHAAPLPTSIRTTVIPASHADDAAPDGWPLRLAARHFGRTASIRDWLAEHATAERFDVVMLNGAVLGQYAGACRIPVVWNLQDELVLPALRAMRRDGVRRWPATLRAALIYGAFESHVMRRVAATVCVSSVDAAWARTFAPFARIEVIENGVDLDYFASGAQPASADRPGAVTFIGALDFPPNIDAVTWYISTIWPRVRGQGTSRRFVVVGRDPAPAVRAACQSPGVELHANVPDVRPYLHAAGVVVVPVRRGGGLKNKILEACAAGRPVIVTPQALGGLSARPDVDLLVARTPRQWVHRTDMLLWCTDAARRIGMNGQRWVRAHHDWAQTGRRFLAVLHTVATRRRARGATLAAVPGGTICR